MSGQIKDGGAVDVLAVMDRLEDYYRRHEVLIGPVDDAYSVEHKAARLAVAELIDKVDSTLALGWSDTAARELRAARAHCGGAK